MVYVDGDQNESGGDGNKTQSNDVNVFERRAPEAESLAKQFRFEQIPSLTRISQQLTVNAEVVGSTPSPSPFLSARELRY